MRHLPAALTIASVAACAVLGGAPGSSAQDHTLRPASAFADIKDAPERSRALFREALKVIANPRCMNCHPAGDRPLQGADSHPHLPPVKRGPDGGGVPGNYCGACHTDRNVAIFAGARVSY